MTGRRALVKDAALRLARAGVASPEYDAAELLAHVLGTTRANLALSDTVDDAQAAAFEELVRRRETREPLQHLVGSASFRYVELAVGPGVFTPRPETELLAGWGVERAREVLAEGRTPVVVDLCTGSWSRADAQCEEAIGLGAYERVLTVLQIPDLPDPDEAEERDAEDDGPRDWRDALRGYRLGD